MTHLTNRLHSPQTVILVYFTCILGSIQFSKLKPTSSDIALIFPSRRISLQWVRYLSAPPPINYSFSQSLNDCSTCLYLHLFRLLYHRFRHISLRSIHLQLLLPQQSQPPPPRHSRAILLDLSSHHPCHPHMGCLLR